MKKIKKYKDYIKESVLDYDAYDIIKKTATYKKLSKGKYRNIFELFLEDLEEELEDILDFGDTDIYRAAETVFNEKY